MNPDHLYPYLVPGLINPGWEPVCVAVGHGVWAQLFTDTEAAAGIVHTTVSPEQLRDAGLTPEEAHARALENLVRFADDSPDLSIQLLGNPGDAVNFLLYCDHPRAAACLRLPDLYEQACDLLKATEVCAVVPQRESLVVLPKRDRAYREMIVGKLRELEADANRPISFELFELTPAGVREFHES
ncbi:hypothetical protein J0H58_07555 [bacterium]|nr:hypothetical protein [bacterium]